MCSSALNETFNYLAKLTVNRQGDKARLPITEAVVQVVWGQHGDHRTNALVLWTEPKLRRTLPSLEEVVSDLSHHLIFGAPFNQNERLENQLDPVTREVVLRRRWKPFEALFKLLGRFEIRLCVRQKSSCKVDRCGINMEGGFDVWTAPQEAVGWRARCPKILTLGRRWLRAWPRKP
jgi:hypothetical protein